MQSVPGIVVEAIFISQVLYRVIRNAEKNDDDAVVVDENISARHFFPSVIVCIHPKKIIDV
jgi:hypothetical protein